MGIEVEITKKLQKEIDKIFKKESIEVLKLLYSLRENPHKGKIIGKIGHILIKEIKYNTFRFYFITNGHRLKLLLKDETIDLILKFVRMSKKNNQQETIEDIKKALKKLDYKNF